MLTLELILKFNTKPTTLLLDFDGVLSPGPNFSDIYAEEFGIDVNVMMPFFRSNVKDLANTNQADLKDLLEDIVETWKWKGTVDELLEYWLQADSDVDERIVKVAKQAAQSGIKVCLASDQEKYRTEFIWEKKGLKDWLDGRFVYCEIGYCKDDPEFFRSVIDKLGVTPEGIFFFDDSQSKVDSALTVGINAFLYTTFEEFKIRLEEDLNINLT